MASRWTVLHLPGGAQRGRGGGGQPVEWTGPVGQWPWGAREVRPPAETQRGGWSRGPEEGPEVSRPTRPRKAAEREEAWQPVPHTDTGRQGADPRGGRAILR
jgi:hypothetical protein